MNGYTQNVKIAVSSSLYRFGFRQFLYAKPLDPERYEMDIQDAGFRSSLATTRASRKSRTC